MTSLPPLFFHPLPYVSPYSYLALSGANETNTRAQMRYSMKSYNFCSDDISVVYTNRPVEIGETVYLRFGPATRHNFCIGFDMYVGFTEHDPKTLNSSCIPINFPGFWLSKVFANNENDLYFTLDPSGIIDFKGGCTGYQPVKSLELGEVSRPLWAVISVPEHPFYVEIEPPPERSQDTECVPDSTTKSSTDQDEACKGNPEPETSQNDLPNQSEETLTENLTTLETYPPSTNRETSNDTVAKLSHANDVVQQIASSSNGIKEQLALNNPIQEGMTPGTSPVNNTVEDSLNGNTQLNSPSKRETQKTSDVLERCTHPTVPVNSSTDANANAKQTSSENLGTHNEITTKEEEQYQHNTEGETPQELSPLGFHPLSYLAALYLVMSGETKVKRGYSLKPYNLRSDNICVVFTNRPVEIGETVSFRIGPPPHSNVSFNIHVGFTKRDPNTLKSAFIPPNISGFWLTKIYARNETIHFTLDPSGIIDFEGRYTGYEPFKKLELGEVTSPLWAVISVPEYPYHLEIVPPPPDAKPLLRKIIPKQSKEIEQEVTLNRCTVQDNPSERNTDPETSLNITDKSLDSGSNNTTPLANETEEKIILPHNNSQETVAPMDPINETSSPSQSPDISAENEITQEICLPDPNSENTVSNNTGKQKISPSSIAVTENLPSNGSVQRTSELFNAAAIDSPLTNKHTQQDSPSNPEAMNSSLEKEETPPIDSPLYSTIPVTPSSKISKESSLSDKTPENSLSSYTAARNVFLNKYAPVTLPPRNVVTNISVSATSSPNNNIQKDSLINVPVHSKLNTTNPVNSSHSEPDPVNPSQNIVVTINSSPNSVIVVSPETNGISELLERSRISMNSSQNITMTSEQNGDVDNNPSQNALDSKPTAAENPDEDIQITINEEEFDHPNIEGETLLNVPSQQTDGRPNKKRRYCLIFSFAMISVVAVALILYFTL